MWTRWVGRDQVRILHIFLCIHSFKIVPSWPMGLTIGCLPKSEKLEIRLLRLPRRARQSVFISCLLVLFLPTRPTWKLALKGRTSHAFIELNESSLAWTIYMTDHLDWQVLSSPRHSFHPSTSLLSSLHVTAIVMYLKRFSNRGKLSFRVESQWIDGEQTLQIHLVCHGIHRFNYPLFF